MKKGPEKGKVYEVVKRKLEMKSIGSVSLRLVAIFVVWKFMTLYNMTLFVSVLAKIKLFLSFFR